MQYCNTFHKKNKRRFIKIPWNLSHSKNLQQKRHSNLFQNKHHKDTNIPNDQTPKHKLTFQYWSEG